MSDAGLNPPPTTPKISACYVCARPPPDGYRWSSHSDGKLSSMHICPHCTAEIAAETKKRDAERLAKQLKVTQTLPGKWGVITNMPVTAQGGSVGRADGTVNVCGQVYWDLVRKAYVTCARAQGHAGYHTP